MQAMIFHQLGNLLVHEDGPAFLKPLTEFMIISLLQLSLLLLCNILNFNPAACQFNIPQINTKLTHLFMLAGNPGSLFS